jgi:restriction system protein
MGRRRSESLLDIAIESSWPTSAAISAAILFVGYVLVPNVLNNSPIVRSLSSAIKPFCLLLAGLFALIALVKWLAERTRSAKKQSLPSNSVTTPVAARSNKAWEPSQPTDLRREPILSDTLESAPVAEWSLELIQSIEWKRFEDLCQQFYEVKGIRSECTPLGPDGGIDVRLFQDESGKATAIVQCKAWGESYVGVKPIRELLGVMVHENVGKAFFMTSGKYSEEAKAFAAPNRITLIDGKMFLAMILRLPDAMTQQLLALATAGDYNVPSCPTCGTKMRLVQGKEGRRDFWGCATFPKCRQRLGARRGARNVTAYYE